MKRGAIINLVLLARASNGFTPLTSTASTNKIGGDSLKPLSLRSSMISSSSSSLNAWNPFGKEEDIQEVAAVIAEEPVPGALDAKNAVAAAVWVGLVGWAFLLAPGSLASSADNDMIMRLATQPIPRPEEINELWFAVWNCFTVVPAVLAALQAPVGRGQRLPAAPFLWASAFLGYFALGPYFSTRTVRSEAVQMSDLGWGSRNIFENRVFGILLSAIAISIPFSSDLFNCDIPTTIAGYTDLAESSRFVAVATVDIAIMSVVSAISVFEDCNRRGWEDKAVPALVASLLFPVITPCLYLAARPSLEE